MALSREDITRQVEAAHASLRSATIVLENLYAALEASSEGSVGVTAPVSNSRSDCPHNNASPATAMGIKNAGEIRNHCPDCQKYVYADGHTEDAV